MRVTRFTPFLLGACLILIAPVCGATTLGPDAAGYTATNGVPFSFFDISGIGARILSDADDEWTYAHIGFNFNFYGEDFDNVCISANGLLTFLYCNDQSPNTSFASGPISPEVGAIAVLWDDWQFLQAEADAVYYLTIPGPPGSQGFIVQWNLAHGWPSSPAGVTFQAILYEGTNDILFQYRDTFTGESRSSGGSSTVGIRGVAGHSNGKNLEWSFDSPVIHNGLAILFSPHRHEVPHAFAHHGHQIHHGKHGHTEPDPGDPPHVPGHSAGLTLEDAPVFIAAWNADGSVNANPMARALGGFARPAARGSVVQLFGTPTGYRDGQLPAITIGGVPAPVLRSRIADGLWQIHLRIPATSTIGDSVPVAVFYGERALPHRGVVAIR